MWRAAILNGFVRRDEVKCSSCFAMPPAIPGQGSTLLFVFRRYGRWLAGGVVVLIGLFHLFYLIHTPPDWDEASFPYYALHHHVHPWDEVAPAGLRSFMQIYSFPQLPLYLVFTKLIIQTVGLGLWQIRLAPFLSCVGSLILLGFLLFKASHRHLVTALLWFSCTYIFFICAHNARPDPFVLFAGTVSVLWIYFRGGRLAAFMTGFLTGSVFGMHSAASLMLGMTVILISAAGGLRAWIKPATVWWILGVGSALTILLFLFNTDQLAQWSHAARISGNLRDPNLFFFHGNFWMMFCHTVYVAGSRLLDVNILFPPMQASFFAVALIQARRWNSLARLDQVMLVAAFGVTFCYMIANASLTANYLLYVNLWYIFPMFELMFALSTQRVTLDWADAAIFFGCYGVTGIGVFLGRSISAAAAGLLMSTSLLFAILYLRSIRWISPAWLRWGVPLFTAVFVLSFPRYHELMVVWLRWMMLYHRPTLGISAAALLACILTIHPREKGIAILRPDMAPIPLDTIAFVLFGFLLTGFLINDSFGIARFTEPDRYAPEFRRLVASLRGESVLGPAQLYLVDPALSFWSVVAMQNAVRFMHISPVPQINRLNLTYILWPEDDVQSLESALRLARDVEWRRGEPHQTPFGSFVDFRRGHPSAAPLSSSR